MNTLLKFSKTFGLYFDDYFGLYFSVNPKQDKCTYLETSFKTTRNSMNAELRFRKTSVKLLSTPYMKECHNYGKFKNILVFYFIFVFN